MLSLNPMSGGQAEYYLGFTNGNDEERSGEPPGVWHGEGAKKLGLKGEVDPQTFRNLFRGFSPDGSTFLTQRQKQPGRATHKPGWDLTLSAPKSVSVLWGLSEGEDRKFLENAHHRAVKAALDYVEECAGETRRGKAASGSRRPSSCSRRSNTARRAPSIRSFTPTAFF